MSDLPTATIDDPLKERLKRRLETLKQEYTEGQKMLVEIDVRRRSLADSMLRITGAIQVIQEMLVGEVPPDAHP